jgi:hypothetical protein
MTIRKTLGRWFRFLGLGLIVVGILAGSWRPTTWLNYYLRMAILGFLAVSVIGIFAFGFACPRCRRSLLMQAPAILDGRPCACPKCGVSVDEPANSPAP